MRVLPRTSWIAVLGVALAVGASACGDSSLAGHPGTGIVRDVDPAGRKITLDHEDIPGFMKAMTMTFDVAPEVRLEGIVPGVHVDFRVRQEGDAITVTDIQRSES